MSTRYDQDLARWALEQARLLREGKQDQADIENIAEELESMGGRARRELRHRLGLLVQHLLKYEYQAERRTPNWYAEVVEQRLMIDTVIDTSPSLRANVPEYLTKGYGDACRWLSADTGLKDFPKECPWTFDEAMTKLIPDA
ncbi:DUF29 domain-containing protein [Caballeronia sp. LZ032]|uniref:DUF29 domain-containing protein n=1 Tax=Caballeronia sp. LZ032 TaxID=3038565 RepID=UPI0028664B91|nr:DUF29 domain-containing protein [Caballeronia sp. LZ032]MDR5878781.1 DUF29 domain-containing protein [Caballeronia sp. LZ032]